MRQIKVAQMGLIDGVVLLVVHNGSGVLCDTKPDGGGEVEKAYWISCSICRERSLDIDRSKLATT